MRPVLIAIPLAAVSLLFFREAFAANEEILCRTGQAKGLATIRHDPPYLVGTIPSTFTEDPLYFSRRYNCKRRSASVRRVAQGLYDVRFPGLEIKSVVVDAVSDEGVSSAYLPVERNVVRISLRGPLAGGDIAVRRDVAFTVIVY